MHRHCHVFVPSSASAFMESFHMDFCCGITLQIFRIHDEQISCPIVLSVQGLAYEWSSKSFGVELLQCVPLSLGDIRVIQDAGTERNNGSIERCIKSSLTRRFAIGHQALTFSQAAKACRGFYPPAHKCKPIVARTVAPNLFRRRCSVPWLHGQRTSQG